MQPVFDVYSVLCFVGFSQALLWAAVLLQKPRWQYLPNRYLSGLLLALGLAIAIFVLQQSRYIFQVPHLAQIEKPLFFLIPPLVYLYVRALLDQDFKTSGTQLLHALPSLIAVGVLIPFFLQPAEVKLAYLSKAPGAFAYRDSPFSYFVLLQEAFYFGLIGWQYWQSRLLAAAEPKRRWVRNLLAGFLLISIFYSIQIILSGGEDRLYVIPLGLSGFIYALGYSGLRRPALFEPNSEKVKSGKYAKSALQPEQAARYAKRLSQMLESEKPYLNPDISLPALADRLSISTNHLSQVLNQHLQLSFHDLINSHRIEAAKVGLLENGGNLVVEEIAFRVGFNSKSAFNAAFKKHTGTTPSAFRNQHLSV